MQILVRFWLFGIVVAVIVNMRVNLSFVNEHLRKLSTSMFRRMKLVKWSLMNDGLTHAFTAATALPNEALMWYNVILVTTILC